LGFARGWSVLRALCDIWGDPPEQTRFVHVAGTNGKGGTCVMLENVFQQALPGHYNLA
jgi:dihydrofolate synthase/folylpolyglutamate synthase